MVLMQSLIGHFMLNNANQMHLRSPLAKGSEGAANELEQ